MIKFIENSKTKLKFISYPVASFIINSIVLCACTSLLYWSLYLSPINSSLTCQRNLFKPIHCLLKEKSILNSNLTKLDIKNVKKIARHSFASRDGRIIIKANPNPPYFHVNRYQTTFFYPSNPFSLVLFRNFNPLNWFNNPNQENQLDDFIRGKLTQQTLLLELKIRGGDFLFVGIFIGTPSLFIYGLFSCIVTESIINVYEINLENRTLSILGKRIFLKNIKREYKLERIKQFTLDMDDKDKLNSGRIILVFDSDDEYPVDYFFNIDEGTNNFQIIKSFLEKSR